MQPISSVIQKIQPEMRIYFETPQMKDRYVQGARVLAIEEGNLLVETQGKELILGEGTRIDISA